MFESCRDYEESADFCASVDDTNEFWEANGFSIVTLLPLKQVVLKDMAEPIQPIRPWVSAQLKLSK